MTARREFPRAVRVAVMEIRFWWHLAIIVAILYYRWLLLFAIIKLDPMVRPLFLIGYSSEIGPGIAMAVLKLLPNDPLESARE